jgi:hypothetical protein
MSRRHIVHLVSWGRKQLLGRTGGVAACGNPWPRAARPKGNRRLQMARNKRGGHKGRPDEKYRLSTFNFRLSSVHAPAHAASGRSGVAAGSALFLFLGQFADQQAARTSRRAKNL